MTKIRITNKLSLILCIVLIAAMALFTVGCNDNSSAGGNEIPETSAVTVLGEGKNMFYFNVNGKEDEQSNFEIHTDETVVGEALVKLELISGDAGEYGLYVKEVNGIRADYDKDGTYWAFYINGEYAMTGVDKTDITQGYTYSLRIEK